MIENEFRNKLNDILNNVSLYTTLAIAEDNISSWERLLRNNRQIKIDTYCIYCEKETTYTISSPRIAGHTPGSSPSFENKLNRLQGFHSLDFYCLNVDSDAHTYNFSFFVDGKTVKKVGQYPSIADLQFPQSKKYKALLRDDYKNFTKAIGLYANNIGIGSFVYLRRIFENLIFEKRNQAFQQKDVELERFDKAKMEEKVLLLKDYLPTFIVENRRIYSILSKGVHELTEEECLKHFTSIKISIELILDFKLEEIQRINKIKRMSDSISSIYNEMKK